MSLTLWLEINAFIALFFGIMLTCWPKQMMAQSGIVLDNVSDIFARGVGGAILGFALINWGARNYTGADIVWYVVGANIALHVISGIVDLRATVDGTYKNTASGWFSVIFHAVIALIFAYYIVITR